MFKRTLVIGVAILLYCITVSANDSESVIHKFSWAIGYDEGLAGKFFFTNQISANLSLGYLITSADVPYKQPENLFQIKAGGQYLVKGYKKLRINAFIDVMEQLKQGQIPYTTRTGPNKRFNQWITSGRLGLAPELFINDHLSLTYKFGFSMTNFGPTYRLNANETATESNHNNYVKVGVYGFPSDSPSILLHNISLFVYF